MTDIKERLWEENKLHMPVRNRVTGVEWLSRTSKAGATARSMVVYFENELDCNAILASALPFWPLRASSRETLNGQEQERSSPPASTTPTVTTSSEVTPASTQVEQGPRTGSVREKDWQTVPTLRKGKKRGHGEVEPLADNPSSTNRSMAQAASKKGKKKPSSKAVEVLSDKENDDSSSMTTRSATRRLQPSTQTEEEL